MTVSAIFAIYALDALCTIGYCKCCFVAVGKCDCICIYKPYRVSFCNRRNTISGVTVDTFCGYTTIYAVDVPSAVLNSNDRSVPVIALFALDALNALLTLCTVSTIGYGKCSCVAVAIGDRISIYQTLCRSFDNGLNSGSRIALNTLWSGRTLLTIFVARNKYCAFSFLFPIAVITSGKNNCKNKQKTAREQ